MTTTILEQILSRTLITVFDRKSKANMAQLERMASAHQPRGFGRALRKTATEGPAIIAECKKASPSKGVLRETYRPAAIAKGYESAGAAAISVLTEEEFFKGSLDDVTAVSEAVKIPVLQKDFIIDPFQVLEARAAGADAILLIVAAHKDETLRELASAARRWNLDVLCEVHDRQEIDRAVNLGFEIIGVNCRDLKTMHVDPAAHASLVRALPTQVLRVAESGIRTPEDIERLLAAGYDGFLIGETLMRQPDPSAQLSLLLGRDYASDL